MRLFLQLVSVLLSLFLYSSEAQFGVPPQKEAEVNMNGEQIHQGGMPGTSDYEIQTAAKLLDISPDMKESTALDVALMLKFASTDPETALLLKRMKDGSGQQEFQDMAADLTPPQVVEHLVQALADLKMTEALFQKGPERALEEMKKEGIIPAEQMKMYEQDPSLLELDMRKSLYFSFVSLGAAGGFL